MQMRRVILRFLLCAAAGWLAAGDLQATPVSNDVYMPPSDMATITAAEAQSLLFAARKPAIVLIGDSQTQFGNMDAGWVNKLFSAYMDSVDIFNKGVTMGTTGSGKVIVQALVSPMCPQDKISEQVKLVTICFGSNDGSPVNGNLSRRMVALPHYKLQLMDMVAMLQSAGVKNILLITAPPRGDWDPSVMAPYAEAMLAVGKAQQVPVADFFTAIQEVPNWSTEALRADKLHLSPVGNQVLFDTVMHSIETLLPAVAPRAMQQRVEFLESLAGYV